MQREAVQQQAKLDALEGLQFRTEKDFNVLFNQIAPTVTITKLRDVIRKVKAVQRQAERPAFFSKPRSGAATMEGGGGGATEEYSDGSITIGLLNLLHKSAPDDKALRAILDFLLSADPSQDVRMPEAAPTAESLPSLKLPTKQQHMIEVLIKSRRRVWKESVAWDDKERPKVKPTVIGDVNNRDEEDNLSDEHALLEAEQVVKRLASHLPTKKYNSLLELFEAYTGTSRKAHGASTSSSSSGAEPIAAISDEETDATSRHSSSPSPMAPVVLNIRSLSAQLKNRTRSHYHLVAPHLATFFGYDLESTVEVDASYVTSHEKWRLYEQEFAGALLSIQDGLFRDVLAAKPDRLPIQRPKSQDSFASETNIDDLHPSTPTFPVVIDRRFRRPVHVVMEALRLHESTSVTQPSLGKVNCHHSRLHQSPDPQESSFSKESFVGTPPPAPTETTVFLDNLPIDITTDEVKELYGRCGDIAHLQIFNQRTDLDPGPMSHAQLLAWKRRRMAPSPRFQAWKRPRTPVYAMLTFDSPQGYEMCVGDALRIFGMIVRRHPVRSHRASDMTKLYVEGINASSEAAAENVGDVGIPCLELEYQLREHLSPDLFVCLDSNQSNRSMVGSCEIRFQTFETALECFTKIQEMPLIRDDPGCAVQWMRTPKDAMDWWTRKRGFD
jgi:hypothetical protein